MARRTFEEYTRIWFGTTVTKTAPTTTEIAALTDITTYVPKDGLKVGTTNNKVKNDDLSSPFMPEIPGSYGNALTLTCFRDDAADTAWTLFKTRNVAGFVVVRRMVLYTTAAAAAQKVEVYPVTMLQPVIADSAENARVQFNVEFTVTSTPVLDVALS